MWVFSEFEKFQQHFDCSQPDQNKGSLRVFPPKMSFVVKEADVVRLVMVRVWSYIWLRRSSSVWMNILSNLIFCRVTCSAMVAMKRSMHFRSNRIHHLKTCLVVYYIYRSWSFKEGNIVCPSANTWKWFHSMVIVCRWSVVFTYINEVKEEINISEVHDKVRCIYPLAKLF